MLSSVASTSFLSWRLAPSTARPTGTPLASVSRLRLVPSLPRSVGFRPVRSPPSGALVMAPSIASHSQSSPFISSYSCKPRAQRLTKTPAAAHSWKRRWAEEWEQMPVASRAPHWQPVRSTKKMASMALRSATRGLWQPSGWRGRGGSSGYDAFPQRVGDTPLIIDGRSGLGRGAGPSLGHETNP